MLSHYHPMAEITSPQDGDQANQKVSVTARQWFADADIAADELLSSLAKCSTGMTADESLIEILACLLVRSWRMDDEAKAKRVLRNPQGMFFAALNLAKNRLDLIGQQASDGHEPESGKVPQSLDALHTTAI